jgi:hypothetical protein
MKQSYADSSFLHNVDNVIEGWGNGITRENTAKNPNLKRMISADRNDFEKFLQTENIWKRLARLMGPDVEETIKNWGQYVANERTLNRCSREAVLEQVRVQQVDATPACSLLAGVWNSKVFRGRWLRRSAILSSSDCV